VVKYGGDAASSGEGVTPDSPTHADSEHTYGTVDDWGNGELFGERSAPVSLGPLQVRHDVSWD
jgi:hypothetical protein